EIKKIFISGRVTSGDYVRKLEEASAEYLGVEHAVAVSSATSGLILAVMGLGLSGEVIVPSFTFTATVHSLAWNNIKPVFTDCEQKTYNMDADKIEEKITGSTSAIMPVYVFGNPPEMKELEEIARKHDLKLIFDSAQGFGARYQGKSAGGFGNCEVFSLSPTKCLTALEGGLITTNDDKLACFLKSARDYGKNDSGSDIDFPGLSARMSEIHALVGLKNLENIGKHLRTRRRLIDIYKDFLSFIDGISFQEVLEGSSTSGNYMAIFVDEEKFGMSRDNLYAALNAENIQTKKYFYPAVHMQKAYRRQGLKYRGDLPVTERASSEGLALPLYGDMEESAVRKVCRAIERIHKWCDSKSVLRRER
ncbi:MAG: DegT/DnrJ/EryC1/StrS family aminotransferase, partial [Elusimicrobiota bacterium]